MAAKYIPLFPDAHLAKTGHLTLAEQGALLRLYMHAWMVDGCCLPNDDRRLARILGVTLGVVFWALVLWRGRPSTSAPST